MDFVLVGVVFLSVFFVAVPFAWLQNLPTCPTATICQHSVTGGTCKTANE